MSKGLEGGLSVTKTRENVKPAQLKDPTQANPEALNLPSHQATKVIQSGSFQLSGAPEAESCPLQPPSVNITKDCP